MRPISICFLLIPFISSCSTLSEPDIVVDRNDPVSGLQQSDYVNMWWQWAVSMPASESPVRDRVGVKCHVNQTGPVWFLAGGYGTSKIHRKCSIPADKHIFFPVINMVYYPRKGDSETTCESVKKGAALNNDHLLAFKVVIDDHEYLNPAHYRSSSRKCFDLIARKANLRENQHKYPSATDGYWMMLKPLPAGTHKIAFRAEYNRPGGGFGRMVQDIEYELNIYEP